MWINLEPPEAAKCAADFQITDGLKAQTMMQWNPRRHPPSYLSFLNLTAFKQRQHHNNNMGKCVHFCNIVDHRAVGFVPFYIVSTIFSTFFNNICGFFFFLNCQLIANPTLSWNLRAAVNKFIKPPPSERPDLTITTMAIWFI